MNIRSIAFAGAVLGIILSPVRIPIVGAPAPAVAAEYGSSNDTRAPKRDGETAQSRPAPRRKPSPPVPGQSARGPAYKEECVWVGKRVVSLLSRDDAMAASDFMPFYSQFSCPQEHIAKAFACVVTDKDPSENEALADRIDVCWDNPDAEFPLNSPGEDSAAGKEDAKDNGKAGAKPPAKEAMPHEGAPPSGM